ncbi:MAG TPA: thioesterase family protein, partial [Chitinophagaceae bacterium]|nr:thioesterase family protein [Chitinophagaceae bacterium]
PVRITDINYGGHVGNDTILTILHEARMQYLAHLGYSEMQFGGTGMIMSDVAIEFKNELFYGDTITVSVTPGEITKVSFELIYKLETVRDGKTSLVAKATTTMICYDYENKKIVSIPADALKKITD